MHAQPVKPARRPRLLRGLLYALGTVVGALVLLFLVLFVATSGDYKVPATVDHDPSLPSIEVGGLRLHAEAFGDADAPVVIVLHGGPGDDYRMLLPLKALSDQYRVVFYDQRGAGLSTRVPPEQLTIDDYLGELDGVVQHYSPDRKVRLIGHSWGAMIAAGYLSQHPERVEAVVLAEPGALTPEAGRAFIEKVSGMQPPLSFGVVKAMTRAYFAALHADKPDDDAFMDEFMLKFMTSKDIEGHPMAGYFCDGDIGTAVLEHWRFGSTASRVVQSWAQSGADINLVDGAEKFTGPVMFLTGQCDRVIGLEHQQRYHLARFPAATVTVIPGAGHTMFGEKPEASLAAVRTFFGPEQAALPAR